MNSFSPYEEQLIRTLPRILSQLDRDQDSPTFGSFDRDYWHYKIRDFSSIVLQQGMLVLEALQDYAHKDNFLYQHPLARIWADASLSFWASSQLSSGSFNEYYPFEEGYPPTAFSLYAVALLLKQRGFPASEGFVVKAIQKASDWLISHQESQALNQEAVGLTALVLLQDLPGISIDSKKLSLRLDALFDAQSIEGWFPEYGGADIGYLSVALDALWDYNEATGDPRAKAAMTRSVRFIAGMVSVAGNTPVMNNSRNTDYVVPYGLIRLAATDPMAKRIVELLFRTVAQPSHFLNSTDDRYICHYVYQSCFRGLPHLSKMTGESCQLPCEVGETSFLPDSGIFIRHLPGKSSLYVAGKKGGVIYAYRPNGLYYANFGWRQNAGEGRALLTHWQDPETKILCETDDSRIALDIKGVVTRHKWVLSTVAGHIMLRVVSFFLGNRIIALLKQLLIFKAARTKLAFHRRIEVVDGKVVIRDTFAGRNFGSFRPVPAPCYSLRHVASADNFSVEELFIVPSESIKLDYRADRVVAEASFDLNDNLLQD